MIFSIYFECSVLEYVPNVNTIAKNVRMKHTCFVNIIFLGCPILTAPGFGTISGGWWEGENVSFTCSPYTQMYGPDVRTCQSNTWTGQDTVCGQYNDIHLNY